jgi:hypothetical protein
MDYHVIRVKSKCGINQESIDINDIKEILQYYQYSYHCLFGLLRLPTKTYIYPHHYDYTYISYFNDEYKEKKFYNLADLLVCNYTDYCVSNLFNSTPYLKKKK